MKLAIYQGAGTPKDKAANLALLAQQAEVAAQQGVDLLVLPELFLTGYNIGEAVWHLAEPFDGESIRQAAEIAQRSHIALLFGYAERDLDTVYNSAALIDASGTLIASYRKIHLYGSQEQHLFTPGYEWEIHTIADFKIGVLICFDVEFPEAVRSLALLGAELVVVPTALMIPYVQIPEIVIPARALENQVFVAYANRSGTEGSLTYCGVSTIVAPDGRKKAIAGFDETLLIADLDRAEIADARSSFSYLAERRPQLYLEP